MNLGFRPMRYPDLRRKHYAPQTWRLLHNFGVGNNPGLGWETLRWANS